METVCHPAGARIRKVRLDRGVTQEELAELANLSRAYMSAIECGRSNMSVWTVRRLAVALGCPPGELFPPADPGM